MSTWWRRTDQRVPYSEHSGGDFDLDVVVPAFAPYHLERNVRSFPFHAEKLTGTLIARFVELARSRGSVVGLASC